MQKQCFFSVCKFCRKSVSSSLADSGATYPIILFWYNQIMSSAQLLVCTLCRRNDFISQRGLNYHLRHNDVCSAVASAIRSANTAPDQAQIAASLVHLPTDPRPMGVANFEQLPSNDGATPNELGVRVRTMGHAADGAAGQRLYLEILPEEPVMLAEDSGEEDEPPAWLETDSDDEDDEDEPPTLIRCGEEWHNKAPAPPPLQELQRFKNYVKFAEQNFLPFSPDEVMAINLLDTLRKKKATLDTYDAVMEWYFRLTGAIWGDQSVGQASGYISREKIMRKLACRYNQVPAINLKMNSDLRKEGKKNLQAPELFLSTDLILPFSKAKVEVIHFNARELIMSMLTDPRFTDEDFLHFDDDPLAPPPDDLDYIADINTGLAYTETYKKLIDRPGHQILVPILAYIDGAATGQFVDLKVEAYKICIGLLNRLARDKEYAWRILGYVPNYRKAISRGKKIFVESQHEACSLWDMDEEEGAESKADVDSESRAKAQDWHAILEVILSTYRQMQDEGMQFDYRFGGKVYKNVEFKFFLAFIKTDTEEADKLCGKYLTRGANVSQLCRYCTCPNDESDSCVAKYPYKTEPMIKALCDKNNEEKLKELSQHNIVNSHHGILMGLHNRRGVHGGCPIEFLHQLLLGMFKYTKEGFFIQLGKDSAAAPELNALCTWIGKLFARQSDRNLPKTQFGNGIQKGKLMGKEMTGVLLLLAAVLQTSAGKKILKSGKNSKFKRDIVYEDWVLLLETLLQWEAYLTQDRMEKKHLPKLEKKNRYVMYLIKKVLKRTKGMGLKLVKFHALMHMVDDMTNFGVPMVYDSGSNESHHKTTKIAAKLTQRDVRVFERQTAHRLVQFHLLDLAILEQKGKPLWGYYDRNPVQGNEDHHALTKAPVRRPKIKTCGNRIRVYLDEDSGRNKFEFVGSRIKDQEKVRWDQDVIEYLIHLQEDRFGFPLRIFTEHHRDGQIFRAHPNYRQLGHWNDWVLVDWGGRAKQPCQIWGFIDLSNAPNTTANGFVENVEGIRVERGVYAVVESADYEESAGSSDLFIPCVKECRSLKADGCIQRRRFYLADVEAFLQPITVIPDIGNENKLRYLQVKGRHEWAATFTKWLEEPHHLDEMDDEYDSSSEEDESE